MIMSILQLELKLDYQIYNLYINIEFKLVKIEDDFTWHKHEDTDETFLVIEGKMGIEFEDETVELNEGEMLVVPKGKKHKPFADKEAKIMLIEPKGVTNTGDVSNDLTAKNDQWI